MIITRVEKHTDGECPVATIAIDLPDDLMPPKETM